MDGSVDKGNVENKVILVQYCQLNNGLEEVKLCSRFLKIIEQRKLMLTGWWSALTRDYK